MAEPTKSLREQKLAQMADTKSDLRNQVSLEDVVDYQLLSNTPAAMIVAMTGKTLEELADRAKQLETTLKTSAAGDFSQG